jgi:DNA-binding response OmpR family regulator
MVAFIFGIKMLAFGSARPGAGDGDVRVLIVEDDWMIADDLAALLARVGWVTVMAGSVPQAIERIDRQPCDVAILDANLNGLSAETVAQALRRRGIPFLVVSGYASDQRSATLAEAPFVPKPYNEAELIARVRALGPKTN